MKALVPTADHEATVRFADVAEPAPAPHEAVIALEAFSVNRGETFLLDAPRSGWRPGKDIAGIVARAAADGSGPAAGSRVVAHPDHSGWAERAAVPTSQIAVLPDSISTTTAAALPLAGLTAIRLLRAASPLVGSKILITGASGGVGHYFVELAVASGAEVTAIVGSADRGAQLRAFGAAVSTDIRDVEGLYDVALESVGGETFNRAALLLRPLGRLVWFGQASKTAGEARFFDLLYGHSGIVISHFSYIDSEISIGADLATLVRLTEQGRTHPEIGETRDWAETAAMIAALRGRKIRGNAVLTLSRP